MPPLRYRSGGTAKSIAWTLDKPAPDEMATIAVFDGKCARAYLTTEGTGDYIPYGLDALAGLANDILPELEKRLVAEIATQDVDPTVLEPLRGNTKVGALIESFGPKTKQEDIERLADLTDEELKRFGELEKTLADEDPQTSAKKIRLEIQRIDGLVKRIDGGCKLVSDEAVEKLQQLDKEAGQRRGSYGGGCAEATFRGASLARHWRRPWRRMFEAAQKYSVEAGLPRAPIPPHGRRNALSAVPARIGEGRRTSQTVSELRAAGHG